MEEWKTYKLEDLLTIKYGKNQKAVESENGNIPIYGTGGLMGYATKPLYDKPSILIGRKGTIDKVKYVDHPFWTVDTLFYSIVNESIVIPKFLYYKMSLINFMNYNEGTTIPSLRTETLNRIEFNIPPLSTQQKIAAILSSLDDKIELNNKINENLEQQAQALFKSWFIEFEPFGGKMPEGWKEVTLDSFCNIFTGRKNANASVENGQYKFFTCSPNVLPIDSFIFDGDAIIISGNGAYTGRTRFYSGKFDLYQRTYACTMKEDQNPDYIFILYWIIKFVLSKKIMGGTHGSAIPYIVMDDIAKFVINYDKKVFDDLSKIMKSYILQIQENENQNEKLSEIRDSLLPKLMNGEIETNSNIISKE